MYPLSAAVTIDRLGLAPMANESAPGSPANDTEELWCLAEERACERNVYDLSNAASMKRQLKMIGSLASRRINCRITSQP